MQTQLSHMPLVPWRGVWKLVAALTFFGTLSSITALAADKSSGELRIAFAFLGAQRMIPWVEVPSGGIKQYQIFIYDYLVGCTDDGQLSANHGIAQSWEESADKLQWTFKLRPNVRFHDGTALTADDVKFSIDSVLDPKAVGLLGPARAAFKEVEVKDAATVVIHLHQPVIFLPWNFSCATGSEGMILPSKYFQHVGADVSPKIPSAAVRIRW